MTINPLSRYSGHRRFLPPSVMPLLIQHPNLIPKREQMAQGKQDKPGLVQVAGETKDPLEPLSLVLSAVGIDHLLDERTHKLLVADKDVS